MTLDKTVQSAHLLSKPLEGPLLIKSALVHFCWILASLGYIYWYISIQFGEWNILTSSSSMLTHFTSSEGGLTSGKVIFISW